MFCYLMHFYRDLSSCYTYFYNNEENAATDSRTDMEFLHIPFGSNHYKERNQQIHSRTKECSKIVDFLIGKVHFIGLIPYHMVDTVYLIDKY